MKEVKIDNKYAVIGKYESETINFKTKYTNTISSLVENDFLPKDLMYRKNADEVQKYENFDFVYTTYFYVDDITKRHILSFFRIDTFSKIFINDVLVASTHNGFISYDFIIDEYIKIGKNKLDIQLFNPISNRIISKTDWGCFNTERIGVRRTQCTFGWDWVNRFISCGFYKSTIKTYNKEEIVINNVYIRPYDVSTNLAKLKIEFDDVQYYCDNYDLTVDIYDNENKIYSKHISLNKQENEIEFIINNPKLWYPIGYGNQPLYTLKIYQNGCEVYKDIFGFRKIEIQEIKDKENSDLGGLISI